MNFIVVVGSPFPEIQNHAKSDFYRRPLIIQNWIKFCSKASPETDETQSFESDRGKSGCIKIAGHVRIMLASKKSANINFHCA